MDHTQQAMINRLRHCLCVVALMAGCSEDSSDQGQFDTFNQTASADDGVDRSKWSSATDPQFHLLILPETVAYFANRVKEFRSQEERGEGKAAALFASDLQIKRMKGLVVQWPFDTELDVSGEEPERLPVGKEIDFADGHGKLVIVFEGERPVVGAMNFNAAIKDIRFREQSEIAAPNSDSSAPGHSGAIARDVVDQIVVEIVLTKPALDD
ncbi:MAG: hypothetical protein MPJ50_08215 [Pirellulales bacterium]|nr:hypothetical protein [Pirellulales bacterium]